MLIYQKIGFKNDQLTPKGHASQLIDQPKILVDKWNVCEKTNF